MRFFPRARIWLPVLVAIAGCDRQPGGDDPLPTLIHFDSGSVAIQTATDTIPLVVEIADSDDERGYGLMDRDSLGQQSGMLFSYDTVQDSTAGFWMYRTRIPLDIAFIDSTGVISAILSMEPCKSPESRWCDPYKPGVRYQSALEVNRGFFQAHGITPGARVVRKE